MDKTRSQILPEDLYNAIGTAGAPLVVDVRRPDDFEASEDQIVGAIRRLPAAIDHWQRETPHDRGIAIYCRDGQQVSQSIATALAKAGYDAFYLTGGITAWQELELPTRRRRGAAASKWVTR